MFLLHLCRLGGAFSKEYKEDQTCAVEQDDNIEEEGSQFELEHAGVEVCRVARSRLIDHCSRSMDPTIKTSTKRTKPLCAEKFKQLLQISTHSQSTAGSIPKFKPTQAGSLMPEMVLPFDVFKIAEPSKSIIGNKDIRIIEILIINFSLKIFRISLFIF
jgi:hypothetical protein